MYSTKTFTPTDLPKVGQRVKFTRTAHALRGSVSAGTLADVTDVSGSVVTLNVFWKNEDEVVTPFLEWWELSANVGLLESCRGKPIVAGYDPRRRAGTNPLAPATPAPAKSPRKPRTVAPAPVADADESALAEQVAAAVAGVLATHRPAPAAVDLTPVTERLDALTERVDEAEAKTKADRISLISDCSGAAATALVSAVKPITERMDALETALSGASRTTLARAALAARVASGKEPLLAAIDSFYTAGTECAANVLLCSPPSLGKSYSIRKKGAEYDLYLEHGCSDDVDELVTLLGGPTPDNENGGFANPLGVLAEAVTAASGGLTVLLLLDEVLRLSPRVQEWLLTFLTGVRLPSGKRVYRLRTRKLVDGAFEVVECPAENLHVIGATNLSVIAPVEAFWSRWHKVRVEFEPAIVTEVATNVCASYGIASAEPLVEQYTRIVTESRLAVKNGTLRFPADIRLLETACKAAKTPDGKAVGAFIAGALTDQVAHWDIDLGDTLAESRAVCEAWTRALKSL